MLKLKIFILFIGFMIAAKISFAQQDGPVNFTFDSKVKQQTVKKISNLLDENYIFLTSQKKWATSSNRILPQAVTMALMTR